MSAGGIKLPETRSCWKIFSIRFASFLSFFAPDRLDVFGASKNDIASWLPNIVNGNPILSIGFHANILIVIGGKPLGTKAKIFCKRREAVAFVGSDTLLIGGSDTNIDERFVDIYSAADWVNDYAHKHILSKVFEKTDRD